ncbi:hypothetical protein BpHYR1_021395 [Brachionus plicatilis]|uniref:Uncharacterized protein n=1 Tax=Brachionus plicatilis TaxID=10195 RepID=A0A3M7QBQ5_BRAPC|nr:hypothetical protein BpHYR1_021395 [Brachionus plicatilis]
MIYHDLEVNIMKIILCKYRRKHCDLDFVKRLGNKIEARLYYKSIKRSEDTFFRGLACYVTKVSAAICKLSLNPTKKKLEKFSKIASEAPIASEATQSALGKYTRSTSFKCVVRLLYDARVELFDIYRISLRITQNSHLLKANKINNLLRIIILMQFDISYSLVRLHCIKS